jgi:hypothetical protein
MDEQHSQDHDASPPQPLSAASGMDARYLRAGITAFIAISVLALAGLRASDYWARTHGDHAVPVDVSAALAAYLPAAVLYLGTIAAAVYVAVRRRTGRAAS